MELMTKLGSIADRLAAGMKDRNHRFIIVLIFALASAAGFLFSSSILLSISILAIGVMGMLFSLLAPGRRPEGWQAIWTFYLMLCYFIFALALLVFIYFADRREVTPSQLAEQNWADFYDRKFVELNEGVRIALTEAGLVRSNGFSAGEATGAAIFKAIDERIEADPARRVDLLQVATALESYRLCVPVGCTDPVISERFDERILEIWANYRCTLARIASTGGYANTMVRQMQIRFEEISAGSEAMKDSLGVCESIVPMSGPEECDPAVGAAFRATSRELSVLAV